MRYRRHGSKRPRDGMQRLIQGKSLIQPGSLGGLNMDTRQLGRPLYQHEFSLNNSDDLIFKGSEILLERVGCEDAPSPDRAGLIMDNSGFMSDFWPFDNKSVGAYSSSHSGVLLVILLRSFHSEETGISALFSGRSLLGTIFIRERTILSILQAIQFRSEAEFGLDLGAAFALAGAALFARRRSRTVSWSMQPRACSGPISAAGAVAASMISAETPLTQHRRYRSGDMWRYSRLFWADRLSLCEVDTIIFREYRSTPCPVSTASAWPMLVAA